MSDPDLPPMPTEYLHSYNGECWWCGEPADSKEHRGHYGDQVIWGHDDRIDNIRGSKAAGLTGAIVVAPATAGYREEPPANPESSAIAWASPNKCWLSGNSGGTYPAVVVPHDYDGCF